MAAKKDDPAAAEVTQEPAAVGPVEQQDVKGAELAGVPQDSPVVGGRTDGPILTAEPPADADNGRGSEPLSSPGL